MTTLCFPPARPRAFRPLQASRRALATFLIAFGTAGCDSPPGGRAPDLPGNEDEHGQKGGSVGGVPGRCEEIPPNSAKNEGLTVPLDNDNARAWLAYADTLCFVELAGNPGDPPASHLAPRGKSKIPLWILPERHAHQLAAPVLKDGRGRIVARIWNADPQKREFPEWTRLKHGNGPAYLWIGTDGVRGTIVSKVFTFRDPLFASLKIDVAVTGGFRDSTYATSADKYARAMWGYPHQHTAMPMAARSLSPMTGHNVGWIDCPTGCCSATNLW